MRNIKSTDPRKKQVVNAIKQKSGANKVTLVKENRDGSFQGHALKGGKQGYESLGIITVTAEEAGINVIKLSSEEWNKFQDAIKNPPPPSQTLIDAHKRYREMKEKK